MENNKPHNKPDWKELASFMSNIAPDANSTDAFIKGCEHVWNTYVVPLQEENNRLKSSQNFAIAESKALREEIERLKAEAVRNALK